MKNKLYIILIIIFSFVNAQEPIDKNELLRKANNFENQEEEEEALKIYIQLFQSETKNYTYLKKIKKILIKIENFETLIDLYKEHIANISNPKNIFEREVELIELKIWSENEIWEEYLYQVSNKYSLNENNYILHKLIQNQKIEECYRLIHMLREKHNKPSFFSKQLISTFGKNKYYREGIDEAILYLYTKSGNYRSIPDRLIIEQIFIWIDKLLSEALSVNLYLPISNKQFTSNPFLGYNFKHINKENDINYIIDIYNKLIKSNIAVSESKLRLANIKYKILYDLDSAYDLYHELEKKSSRMEIDTKAILGKADILITKGYLDSAFNMIHQRIEFENKYNEDNQSMNDLNYKKAQILFYQSDYSNMNQTLDTLINNMELKNENLNELLEIKTISLFFNEEPENFKIYSSIQHKIKMNKSFESILELIQLVNEKNILISELAQFQYAIIELQKGNVKNTQQIINSMNKETIFYEISFILNAEIEDHINKNYKLAKKLYQDFITKYPNSIYKENILKRLNEIEEILKIKLDS